VAGTRLGGAVGPHKYLLPALARSHQQSGCPLAARYSAGKLARFAPTLGFASCHPGCFFGYRSDSSRRIMCLLDQSPNQTLERTADPRENFYMTASTLKFAAQPVSVGGRSAPAR
jgi:hypothetical protein